MAGNSAARNSTSFFQPMSRPCVFCSKNSESDRNNDERRARQNQQSNPDQQDGYSDHGDNYTFNNLDVLKIPNAEEAFHPTWKSGRPFHCQSAVSSHHSSQLNWIGRQLSAARKRSRKGTCAGFIFWRAISSVKNSSRSISGNSLGLPERGGHSISNKFDLGSNDSGKSPSNAQACTVLPPFCLIEPSSIQPREFSGRKPTSSSNSI